MPLLRVTAHDNHQIALEPASILAIRTVDPADRKVIVGVREGNDPKTEIVVSIDGQPKRVWLRNPPRRLATKLLSLGAVRAWWQVDLASGGVGFTRPSSVHMLEEVPPSEREAEGYDQAETLATLRLAGQVAMWRCFTSFDLALRTHEAALAKESGLAPVAEDQADDVGGLEDDEDAVDEDDLQHELG